MRLSVPAFRATSRRQNVPARRTFVRAFALYPRQFVACKPALSLFEGIPRRLRGHPFRVA
jgi:hypothetical protein